MIYYEKDYYAVPDTGAEKAYELLRQALLAQKKVAIAKIVMGTNEKLLVLYPTKEGIIVKTLFYYDEIAAIPKSVPRMKLDGFRCLAYIDYGMVDLRNKRNIRMLPRFPELKEISKNVGGRCILDGEIVVLTNGVPDFYRLQKRTLLTDKFKIEMEALRYPASFVAFDCIYIEGKELIWTPLMDRKEQLSRLVNEDSRIAVSRYVEGSGTALYMAAEASKLEGVVAKRKDSFYLMGKRTKDWIKFKRMADEDFVVAGYIKKGGHMYSLVLAKYKGNTLIFRGYVTSGVTKEAIDTLEVTGKNPFLFGSTGVNCKTSTHIIRQRGVDDNKIKCFFGKCPFGSTDTCNIMDRVVSCFGEQVSKGRGETICCRHDEYAVKTFS